MTPKPLCKIWVASCVPEGGAYRFSVGEDGKLTLEEKIPMPSPMWLEKTEKTLWAVLRAPWEGKNESAAVGFDVESGKQIGEPISTQGEVACHLATDGNDFYAANYVTGSLIRLPDKLVTHEGHGVNPKRQERPHVHSVVLSPDGYYLLSCDLGLDTVFVYDRDLNEISRVKVPDGAGARHLVFSNDGSIVYEVNEMGASVSVFTFENGKLTLVRTVPILDGEGKASAVCLTKDGKRLYVAERETTCIVVYDVKGTELTELERYDSFGEEPRDFRLIANDRFAVCTNQFSGNVVLFTVEEDGGLLFADDFELPQAISVVEE